MEYFADLHVHLGAAKEQPVKITASRALTLANIFHHCKYKKGIDIVGVVDCASPLVLEEIQEFLNSGELVELDGGGLLYEGDLLVILGAEIETREQVGAAHNIAFFPKTEQIKEFSAFMDGHITNINLSTQKTQLSALELLRIVKDIGGELIPAHIFTPFKSFYGRCYDRLSEAFGGDYDQIKTVELGLSSNTDLADTLSELSRKSFLSNSDAHSVGKIAREYNVLKLKTLDFQGVFEALENKGESRIVANFGLDPLLGKYHRTQCLACEYTAMTPPPVVVCPKCHGDKLVVGVLDRIVQIRDLEVPVHPGHRPPYFHHIPLEFIPGIGKKTLDRLVKHFGSEMKVLHKSSLGQLKDVVREDIARYIIDARKGSLKLQAGGGGVYGKIISK